MLRRTLLFPLSMILLAAPVAAQNSYFFEVLHNNGVLSLAPGSDPMIGTTLFPGDDFTWRLSVDGPGFWEALQTGGYFPIASFGVAEAGARRGDFELTMWLDGVAVLALGQNGVHNTLGHVGANEVFLFDGLRWDEIVLTFRLTAARSGSDANDAEAPVIGTTFKSLNGFDNYPPEVTYSIDFVPNELPSEVVPEPATMVLVASGLLGMAGVRRRRVGLSPPPAAE